MKSLLILLCSMLFLTACASELPPEPETPGSAGQYYKSVGNWATEPLTFSMGHGDLVECSIGESVDISYELSGDQFSYRHFFIWQDSFQTWGKYDFVETPVSTSKWIRGDASYASSILCEDLLSLADADGSIYAAGYSCSFVDGAWDCHDNKWQLQVFDVVELPSEYCIDSDGGINYGLFGTTTSHDDSGEDVCVDSFRLSESYCDDTTIVQQNYDCLFGCFNGECIDEPDEITEPTTNNLSTIQTLGNGSSVVWDASSLVNVDSSGTKTSGDKSFNSGALSTSGLHPIDGGEIIFPLTQVENDVFFGVSYAGSLGGNTEIDFAVKFEDRNELFKIYEGGLYINKQVSVPIEIGNSVRFVVDNQTLNIIYVDGSTQTVLHTFNDINNLLFADFSTYFVGDSIGDVVIVNGVSKNTIVDIPVDTSDVEDSESENPDVTLGTGVSTTEGGLLWTPEEVAIWNQRAQNGPYVTQGDAYDPIIPGEWERIEASANRFRSDSDRERKNAIQFGSSAIDKIWIRNHQEMLDAAFYALVMDDAALKEAVKQELLWHANKRELQRSHQFSDTRLLNIDHSNWWQPAWFIRLLNTADFVRDSFTEEEMVMFLQWIGPWADIYERSMHDDIRRIFPDRYDEIYEENANNRAPPIFLDYTYITSDGQLFPPETVAKPARTFHNRKSSVMQFAGTYGAFARYQNGLGSEFLYVTNGKDILDKSLLYFKEWMKFTVYPDGSTGEWERNRGAQSEKTRNMQQGLLYNTINLEAYIAIADILARKGNVSLYEYSTCEGMFGTECAAGDSPKNIKLLVDIHFDLISYKKDWYNPTYGFNDDGTLNEDARIDGISEGPQDKGVQWINEIWFAPLGNKYWKSEDIKNGYMRTGQGFESYSRPLGPAGPFGDPWRGHGATNPSYLFMYAEMEDKVNPYPTLQ